MTSATTLRLMADAHGGAIADELRRIATEIEAMQKVVEAAQRLFHARVRAIAAHRLEPESADAAATQFECRRTLVELMNLTEAYERIQDHGRALSEGKHEGG